MNAFKIFAILLILAGTLSLVFGGFSYTRETHETKIGALELSVKDEETVRIPVWAGVGSIVIGSALLLFAGRRR
ncbi:MAG: hypothetical protein WBN31_01635 [Gammaproteobacteria bacterium]